MGSEWGNSPRNYVRIVDYISDKVGIVAMALIAAMIGILLLDAVTRNLIKMPLHWCIELAQFTLTAYYFLGGPVTLKNNDHVRMDLFYDWLSVKGKAWMDLVTSACLFFYLTVLLTGRHLEPAICHRHRRKAFLDLESVDDTHQGSHGTVCLVLMLLQTISLAIKHTATIRGTSLS